jgi:hypothetical protein
MNPFKPETDSDKFFKEMTKAINEWMLEKYPLFDDRLENKIKNLEYMNKQAINAFEEHKKQIEEDKKVYLHQIKEEINKFLKKDFPDLSPRLSLITQDLEKAYEKHKKLYKEADTQCKVILKGASLYEDVYKLRDEFKEFKKEFESFTLKMKRLFSK